MSQASTMRQVEVGIYHEAGRWISTMRQVETGIYHEAGRGGYLP